MRFRPLLFPLILSVEVLALLTAAPRAAAQVPVKATQADEVSPVAGNGYFAWAQNSLRRPHHFDVYAQKGNGRPFRVNAVDTQGMPGGISGRTLVYQQWRGMQSEIEFINLEKRTRVKPPKGTNTRQWESRPSLSGPWLLFDRADRHGSFERVLLRNLQTGAQVELARTSKYPVDRVLAGQVAGRFAVGTICQVRCAVFRYDISARKFTKVSPAVIPEAQDFAASVTDAGTLYLARTGSLNRCSQYQGVSLLRIPLREERSTTIETIPPRTGIGSTYATMTRHKPVVYYSRGVCNANGSDIYKISDG